ncbi:XrtA/PEP-CTERM system TPR-repeat protein PrsT [Massilia glaciei]|nr:XrtA/PEP-CTERM system TPR-repeat protein PrsT [Massilia glaciei]
MSVPLPPRRRAGAATLLAVTIALSLGGCGRGGDSAALIAEARQYREKGEMKAAVIQLKNVLQKDADNLAARTLLGEVYRDQGDPVSAEKELRRALALGGDKERLTVLLGKTMLMQGRYEALLDEIKSGPGRPALLALRGNAVLGQPDIGRARALFEQALALDAASSDALLGLARIAAAEGRTDEAAGLIARALAASPADRDCLRFKGDLLRLQGKPELALAAYRHLLAIHPNNAQAHIDIANLHLDAGKFDAARTQIAAARASGAGTLAVFYSQAMLDFREGKHAAALEALQQIIRVEPDHYPSILLLGAVQSALGSTQTAEQHLQKFLNAYPGHAYAGKLMAALQVRAKHPEAALALVRPLLEQNPDDVELLTLAGEAHMAARQFSRAAEHYEKAAGIRPDAPKLRTALALSRLGNGDSARAVAELERAAGLDRGEGRIGVLLVMSYLRAGQADKALAVLVEMEKRGRNPLLDNLRGGVAMVRKDVAGARASFNRALALDPLYLPALDNLAQLDMLERRPHEAKKRYLAALAESPGSATLMEALARLATREGKTAEAMTWLERAHAEHPRALGLALRLVDFYVHAGEPRKALNLAQKLRAGHPASSDALAMLAKVHEANADLPAAADSYASLASLVPGSAVPLTRLATLRLRMGDQAGAVEALRRALGIAPDLLEARMTLLHILIGQKKFAEARMLVGAAQKRDPGGAGGHKLDGDLLSAQGQHGPALKAYERAFALAPSAPALIQLHGALLRTGKAAEAEARVALWLREHPLDVPTRLYFASGKVVANDAKGAADQLAILLAHDPDNVLALNELALLHRRQDGKRALALAERAHRLAPASPAVMDTLGTILLDAGQLGRALALLRKASALSPQSGNIGYHLGLGLARSGDKRAARKELERVLAAPTPFSEREQARTFLATL